MKKRFLSLLLLPLLLTGCNQSKVEESYNTGSIAQARRSGEIGDFALSGPENGFITEGNFTFTWQEASNADFYQIEIASTQSFVNDDEDEVYVKESNLANNLYLLNFSLPKKDIDYYWRVTAVNKDHTKKGNEVRKFFYKAADEGELEIEIEDPQDWVLHKEGSYADITVDRTNFFNNNKNSLVITFDKEHTCQGIAKSDGWIVVTKTEDRQLYGTDAFYFNFYYSGQDATVLVRVLDYDGEYWHKQVQISNNSKQTILVKYEDFELRTAGTNIFNRKFDWEHIRYFEIVFERTFGDGICAFSNIKAVKFDNYKHMFMDKMDFKSTNMEDWTYENYDFRDNITISDDGNEITLGYAAGFNGYGFQNINVYKYFVECDAIRMKVKYTGTGSNATFYFRILEEDNDRWQFKTPFTYFTRDEYKELIIPLKAFQRVEYMNGDGAKQFYFIQKFNVGLADNYTAGTISIKDLEVIKIRDIFPEGTPIVESTGLSKRVVGADGCVENFNNYNIYTEMYYYWEQSSVNKDEAMKLDNIHKIGGNTNKYCAEFDYKADMEMATYQLYMDNSANVGKTAFSIWLKDNTPKDPKADSSLDENNVTAEMTIQLTMDTDEWYRYVIDKVEKEWHNYTIAFSDFVLNNGESLFDEPNPLSSEHIIHLAFGFKYLYYDASGNHIPLYSIANPVYLDEIYFTNATASSTSEIPGTIKPDQGDEGTVTVETMEGYSDNAEIFGYWSYGSEREYNLFSLDNEVSSQGGTHSIKMHYKGSESVSYVRSTVFSKTVLAKGISLDIKGDDKATVYLNLNLRIGSTVYKMRYCYSKAATVTDRLKSVPSTWTHYEFGFDLFKDVNNTPRKLSQNDAKNIESISFGIVNDDGTESDIYVDNIKLISPSSYSVNTKTVIAQEGGQ